jgi:hypothetical protein
MGVVTFTLSDENDHDSGHRVGVEPAAVILRTGAGLPLKRGEFHRVYP